MARGLNGSVYIDIPPMPNLPVAAAAFPTAAPTNVRANIQYVVDMEGMVSLTHNSTVAGQAFTLLAWSDQCGWFIPYPTLTCAQYNQIVWKVFVNTGIYIYANAALSGGSKAVIGGVTIQGNQPVITAGV